MPPPKEKRPESREKRPESREKRPESREKKTVSREESKDKVSELKESPKGKETLNAVVQPADGPPVEMQIPLPLSKEEPIALDQNFVCKYLKTHSLGPVISAAVNQVVAQRSSDPYALLIDILSEKTAKHKIIYRLVGHEVLDSIGMPSIEVELFCHVRGNIKSIVKVHVPAGFMPGVTEETVDLVDLDESRYAGRGVTKAISAIAGPVTQVVAEKFVGDFQTCDAMLSDLDLSASKQAIGVQTIHACSWAIALGGAMLEDRELYDHLWVTLGGSSLTKGEACPKLAMPQPILPVLRRSNDANMKFCGLSIVPTAKLSTAEGVRLGLAMHNLVGQLLAARFPAEGGVRTADDGSWTAAIASNEDALTLVEEAASTLKINLGLDFRVVLEVGAGNRYRAEEKLYDFPASPAPVAATNTRAAPAAGSKDAKQAAVAAAAAVIPSSEAAAVALGATSSQMVDMFDTLLATKPYIAALIDPFHDKDYEAWIKLTARVMEKYSGRAMVMGTSLFHSNKLLLDQEIQEKWANSCVITPAQVGSVSDTWKLIQIAKGAGMDVMLSVRTGSAKNQRFGETAETFLVDLAVAAQIPFLRSGAPVGSERVCKLNRLLNVAANLQEQGRLVVPEVVATSPVVEEKKSSSEKAKRPAKK